MAEALIDDLAAWLGAQLQLPPGRVVYRGDLPATGGAAFPVTAVRETGGPARPWSPLEDATFQVQTRAANGPAALAAARRVYDVLHPPPDRFPVRNVRLSDDWLALKIEAMQGPTDLGVTDSGLRLAVFNIQVRAARL